MDAKWRQFYGERLADAFNRKLCCSVHAPAWVSCVAADGGQIHDMPCFVGTHVRQNRPGHIEQTENVGAKHIFNLAGTGFLDRAKQAVPGIVDEHVDTAKALNGGLGSGNCLRLVANVKRQRKKPRRFSQCFDHMLSVATRGNDRVTTLESLLSDQ